MTIKYRGYVISQNDRYKHIAIYKDGHLIYHALQNKNMPLFSKKQLLNYCDSVLMMRIEDEVAEDEYY